MEKKFDIIAIGDATMDMFLGLNTVGSRVCRKDTNECFLELSYADKVVADYQEFASGGNSANLAIGSARLGLSSALYTVLGNDQIGDILSKVYEDEGVACEYIRREKGKTNFHVVLNHEAERTIIIYHNKRRYKLPKFPAGIPWLYCSSMGDGFEKLHPAMIRYIKKQKVKLGFNPGTLQLKAGYRVLKPVLEVSEVLLLNTEEGGRLLGDKPNGGVDFKDLLYRLAQVGPKTVVVTDGPKGAYAYDGEKYWFMPIYDVPVIERTGAGDSFSTGLIAALASGLPLREALRWGTFNSASVIGKIGPQAGLLTIKEMKKFLKKNKKVVAREI